MSCFWKLLEKFGHIIHIYALLGVYKPIRFFTIFLNSRIDLVTWLKLTNPRWVLKLSSGSWAFSHNKLPTVFFHVVPWLELLWILYYTTPKKGRNPTNLPPAIGKIVGQTDLYPSYGNLSSRTKTLNSNLLNSTKKTDVMLHPAHVDVLVNIHTTCPL